MKNARAAVLVLFLTCLPGFAQVDDPTLPGNTTADGLGREAMWKAPTAAEWALPVLITFQRTWSDAQAVAKETGKPIMACINMDGEIASEHYAGVRYRQAEVAALYEPFVCVIASVYRHNARDYDTAGNRVLCPRFGSVTCGEHIALEPTLFGLYLDEARVSPRHIVIEADGSESDDVYYANDTASVFRVIRNSAKGRPAPRNVRRSDLSMDMRTVSSNVEDRTAVESAFREGDLETRRRLMTAALETGIEQNELWRLALKSGTPELARLGLAGLGKSADPAAIDLVVETMAQLGGEASAGDREVMISVLDRIGEKSDRARTLAISYRGLDKRSGSVDKESVGKQLANSGKVRELASAVKALESLDPRSGGGGYGAGVVETMSEAHKALARAAVELEMAQSPEASSEYRSYYLDDAVRDLEEARGLLGTPDEWRWQLIDIAHKLYVAPGVVAIQAAETRAGDLVPNLPAIATVEGGMALRDVMAAFMRSRQRSIHKAVRLKTNWPAEWMADARAAFASIAKAPRTGSYDFVQHYDFLRFMGATVHANEVLEYGLTQFPYDAYLHERLQISLLWDKPLDALDGLEGYYAQVVANSEAATEGGYGQDSKLHWFAAMASKRAAEEYRRRARFGEAAKAYRRAIKLNEAGSLYSSHIPVPSTMFAPKWRSQKAQCLFGLGRLAYEAGQDAGAVKHLIAGFRRDPGSADDLDGLNATGITTAQLMLGEGLAPELAAQLSAALNELRKFDPSLFGPVEYEVNSRGKPAVGFDK